MDDDAEIRELLELLLTGEGYAVLQADSGEAALDPVSYTHLDVYKRQLLRRGVDASTICNHTQIDMLFLDCVKRVVDYERVLAAHPGDRDCLVRAKRMGFADRYIAKLWNRCV